MQGDGGCRGMRRGMQGAPEEVAAIRGWGWTRRAAEEVGRHGRILGLFSTTNLPQVDFLPSLAAEETEPQRELVRTPGFQSQARPQEATRPGKCCPGPWAVAQTSWKSLPLGPPLAQTCPEVAVVGRRPSPSDPQTCQTCCLGHGSSTRMPEDRYHYH